MRITCKTLSNMFCCDFHFEVNTPHVSKFNLSLSEETVIAAVAAVTMVRWATVQHMGIISVLRKEGLSEFTEI